MEHTNVSLRKLGRLMVVALLTGLVLLGAMAALALAIELPPAGTVAFIQTSGRLGDIRVGDWYANSAGGDRIHTVQIIVPCTVMNPSQNFTVALFDPESFSAPGETVLDEIRPIGAPVADVSTYTLRAPDNSTFSVAYPPALATHNQWVTFTTFSGCGVYDLEIRVGHNNPAPSNTADDENAWKLRVTPDDPDGAPGSGDEISLGLLETSFQHDDTLSGPACQSYHFFVPATPTISLNNFDLDVINLGATITYIRPDGSPSPGTASDQAVWANDLITGPQHGWWQAEVCVARQNQYIFEPGGLPFFFQQPLTPTMTVGKDDGLTLVGAGQIITYTIVYQNNGPGAALNVTLTDNLPAFTTFVSCSGATCGEAPPGSGVVNYSIGTVAAGAPPGQVFLTVQVDPAAPPSTLLTNTVQLDYQDTLGNQYPPERATDVDILTDTVAADLSIIKTDNPDPVAAGALLNYTLEVRNAGPDDAQNVVVVDTLPAGVTFISSTPSQGTCAGLSCTLGTILVGGQANIVVVVRVNNGTAGPLLNSAQVSSDTPDPNPRNNRDDEPTSILTQAPTPTKPPSSSGRGDDPTPTPTPIPVAPPVVSATPTPAVFFLPETGVGYAASGPGLWPLALVPGLGLLGWAILRRRGK